MADFSGSRALDEVYDGPSGVPSGVDNRRSRRRAYRALDHDPTQQDVHEFLADVRGPWPARPRPVLGITTEGSPLSPKPLQALWPGVRHPGCASHVRKDILQAVRHAVAKLRQELAARLPKPPRGRPRREQQARARGGSNGALTSLSPGTGSCGTSQRRRSAGGCGGGRGVCRRCGRGVRWWTRSIGGWIGAARRPRRCAG